MERDPRAVHLYPASTAGARHEIVLPPVAPKKARVGLRLSMLKRTYFCAKGDGSRRGLARLRSGR